MAYSDAVRDFQAIRRGAMPGRVPVCACSEEFDVKWHGQYLYEDFCQDGQKMFEVLQATIDRTARLTAYLMYKHGIPLRRVVPHYHWPRHGVSKPHKNCPHFLLDNGRPGRKWKAFQRKVQGYYDQATATEMVAR